MNTSKAVDTNAETPLSTRMPKRKHRSAHLPLRRTERCTPCTYSILPNVGRRLSISLVSDDTRGRATRGRAASGHHANTRTRTHALSHNQPKRVPYLPPDVKGVKVVVVTRDDSASFFVLRGLVYSFVSSGNVDCNVAFTSCNVTCRRCHRHTTDRVASMQVTVSMPFTAAACAEPLLATSQSPCDSPPH